jgi:hypothetical protein
MALTSSCKQFWSVVSLLNFLNCPRFEGFITYIYVVILSCILLRGHECVISLFQLLYLSKNRRTYRAVYAQFPELQQMRLKSFLIPSLMLTIPPRLSLLIRLRFQKPYIESCKKLSIFLQLRLYILYCSENKRNCVGKRH